MLAFRKIKNRGFTIVELLIVIVVIGILATLVITTYNGIQQKARDTKRKTDIGSVATLVEAYNSQSGNYPTLANLNDTTFRSANMKGLDPSALVDPKSNCNPATTSCVVGTPAANVYSYAVSPTGCDNSTTDCTSYTLTATLEAGGTFTKSGSN